MNELLTPQNVPVAEDYKYQLGGGLYVLCHIRFSAVVKGKISIARDAQDVVREDTRLVFSNDNPTC